MAVNLRVYIRTVCKHFKNFIDQDSSQADILKVQPAHDVSLWAMRRWCAMWRLELMFMIGCSICFIFI